MAFNSLSTTSFGNFAYERFSAEPWPSVIAQLRNFFSASRFPASLNFSGISSQVKLEIGYAVLPGALVIDTRKSSGIVFTAPAAASVTLARSALTKEIGRAHV